MKIKIIKLPNNIKALGGVILSNSTNFSTGLTHISTGESHEKSPYGGVPMGTDRNGVPNLVEENEVVYNDYVYSDRLTVPKLKVKKNEKPTLELKVLKRYEGMTYADAAKKAEKLSGVNERPNDDIAKKGFEAELEILARSQEQEREIQRLKEMLELINSMTPEEFALMQLQLEQLQAAELQAIEQLAQQDAIAQQEAAVQLAPELQLISPEEAALMLQLAMLQYVLQAPLMAEGGLIETLEEPANTFDDGGFKDWWYRYIDIPLGIRMLDSEGNIIRSDDSVTPEVLNADWSKLYKFFTLKDDLKDSVSVYKALESLYKTNPELFKPYSLKDYAYIEPPTEIPVETPPVTVVETPQREVIVDNQTTPINTVVTSGAPTMPDSNDMDATIADIARWSLTEEGLETLKNLNKKSKAKKTATNSSDIPKMPTWPYVTAGAMLAGLLMHNIFSPKNYTNADTIEAAARRAGTYQPVSFSLNAEYLKPHKFDRLFYANQLGAQAGATRRAIVNNAAGNRGTAIAGLLAADNNFNNQLGNLYRLAEEYLLNADKEVAEHNNRINLARALGNLEAARANQLAGITARSHELAGMQLSAAMRQGIDDTRAQAISAGLTGLANLGLSYALNKYNGDLYRYYIDHMSSYGGKLRTRRKRSLI